MKHTHENRFIRILDNMTEGCQIISPEWRYLYVNKAAAAHGNQTQKNLLGSKMVNLYPGIENTEIFNVMHRCMENREQHSMENEFTYPDGSKRWFKLTIQPDPEGIFITSFDITERKRAEEELNKEIDFKKRLIDTAQVIILILDVEGRIVEFNPYMEKLSGYRLEEVKDKDWFSTFLRIIKKDGSVRTVHSIAHLENDKSGKPLRTYDALHDITENKKMEEQLRQAQKMEASGLIQKR